jgi:dTDP-4-dehydrorhamnose 3,5-epimerase
MPIKVTPTNIPDILVLEPRVINDNRGWFCESFNEKEFSSAVSSCVKFVQDNHSFSRKGVLRGLHYQMQQTQGKLVRVVCGDIFSVCIDLRESSDTFGKWVGVELSDENKRQLWIPPGFAHGFLVLSETAQFLYKTTDYWHTASEKCIVWNDPDLNIRWPDIGIEPILNPKDAAGLSWGDAPKFK